MLLNVENLHKRFYVHHLGACGIDGFTDVRFRLSAGEVLVLSGASGSGKSSVLKCLYRSYLPSSGAIHYTSAAYGSVDLATAPDRLIIELRKREISYVSQFLSVLPRVPAIDVVAEPLFERGESEQTAREQAAQWLDRLHLPRHLFHAFPATFSGGEQQRIGLARAFISQPRLLLLDEPTASLDAENAQLVIKLLQGIKAAGCGIVMVLHDRILADEIADTTCPFSVEERVYACH